MSSRPPCAQHGLATGPEGQCALCKRSVAPPTYETSPGAPPSLTSRIATAAFGLGALASVGIVVAGALGWTALDGMGPQAPAPQVDALDERPARPSRGLSSAQPRGLSSAHAPGERRPDPAQALAPQAGVQAESAVEHADAKRKQRLAAETAEQDRKRSEMIKKDMEERALKQARANVSIAMYSTTWCPACVVARAYMTEHSIAFVDHDIEASESARAINRRLNPKGSIPTIDVEGDILVGFSDDSLEARIDKAARKRLR